MIDDNTLVNVTNRSRGSLGYSIPDMNNLQRRFEYGETKKITAGEIRKLDWSIGGHKLIQNCLKIDNQELIEELLHQVEPEYFYTEETIKELLLTGSMDAFMDCLDFAPQGVIGMMKDLAIKLEIPDVRKRDALKKRTGTDISMAININHLSQESTETTEPEEKQRRVQIVTENIDSTPIRRTSGLNVDTPKPKEYKVISKSE